jgi:putative ABC transport system permease protein
MKSSASIGEAFALALGSLRSSKLRSILTLLGVILATTTLIVVMSLVHGMDVYIATEVSDMGTDGFRVNRIPLLGDFDPKKLIELQRKNPRLTVEEYEFLRQNVTLVREFGMQTGTSSQVKSEGEVLENVGISGVTPNMGVITNLQLESGRYFTEPDDKRQSDVAVIGNDVREKFFLGRDPVGKTILIRGRPFQVIGAAKKQGSVFGNSQDSFVQIPIRTHLKVFHARPQLSFAALSVDHARLPDAQEEVRVLLRAYRHLKPNQEDNFGLLASDSLVALWDRLTGVISAMAIGIVSIFMVVGGVVIMNIMLAVVTERTHEIGIRKAVGARKTDILQQFLIESSVLAAAGGVIGITIAFFIGQAVKAGFSVPMSMPASAVIVGIGLSTMVGLFFGVYPAKRAADLDPIEALRSDQ